MMRVTIIFVDVAKVPNNPYGTVVEYAVLCRSKFRKDTSLSSKLRDPATHEVFNIGQAVNAVLMNALS